jgi:hypothetical protein
LSNTQLKKKNTKSCCKNIIHSNSWDYGVEQSLEPIYLFSVFFSSGSRLGWLLQTLAEFVGDLLGSLMFLLTCLSFGLTSLSLAIFLG